MSDIKLVIEVPENYYNDLMSLKLNDGEHLSYEMEMIRNGTPLPRGHRWADIGKIDEDRTDDDNPIIYLTINGEYVEAVSLDYLNSLPTIIRADDKGTKKNE